MNEENVDICQICLRTDLKLKVIDTKLSDFHDEFCDYSMACILSPKYCTICEHLLQKVYNFRAKCIMANEILNGRKKTKTLNELYTLLPPSNLGTWIDSNVRIYQFSYEEQPTLPNINGVIINTTQKEKSNPTDISVPTLSSLHSLIDDSLLLSNITNGNTVLVFEDPLILENEIKSENNEETFTELVKEDKTDKSVDSTKVNLQEVKTENVNSEEDEQLIIDNLFVKDEQAFSYAIENFNEPVFVIETYQSPETVISDDGDLNSIDDCDNENLNEPVFGNETDQSSETVISDGDLNRNDDCDSDDLIPNYGVYCKKQKTKQKKQTCKKTVISYNVDDQNLLWGSKSEDIKRSHVELANIKLSDEDNEQCKKKNAPKRSAPKKQCDKTVKRISLTKKDHGKLPVKEFNEHISKAPGNHFYKENNGYRRNAKYLILDAKTPSKLGDYGKFPIPLNRGGLSSTVDEDDVLETRWNKTTSRRDMSARDILSLRKADIFGEAVSSTGLSD